MGGMLKVDLLVKIRTREMLQNNGELWFSYSFQRYVFAITIVAYSMVALSLGGLVIACLAGICARKGCCYKSKKKQSEMDYDSWKKGRTMTKETWLKK